MPGPPPRAGVVLAAAGLLDVVVGAAVAAVGLFAGAGFFLKKEPSIEVAGVAVPTLAGVAAAVGVTAFLFLRARRVAGKGAAVALAAGEASALTAAFLRELLAVGEGDGAVAAGEGAVSTAGFL